MMVGRRKQRLGNVCMTVARAAGDEEAELKEMRLVASAAAVGGEEAAVEEVAVRGRSRWGGGAVTTTKGWVWQTLPATSSTRVLDPYFLSGIL